MTTTNKSLFLALLMTSLPILAYVLKPAKMTDIKEKIVLEEAVPQVLGDWHAENNRVSAVESNAGGGNVYDQVLSRTYVNSRDEKVMLTIAYGSTQNHELKVHQQEVCYKAGGFEINDLSHKTYTVLDADIYLTQMFARKANRDEPVTYWFTIGENIITDRLERNLTVLKYMFSGMIADGYLIRVSNVSSNPKASFSLHETFIQDMLTNLPKNVSARLLGK